MERNISILIANENNEETNEISNCLTNEKTSIDIAIDGKEAVEKVLANNYDLVVVDLVLPQIDGFEVIEKAKNRNKSTKVIVLSALSSEMFIKKASSLGVEYYMLKPVSSEILSKRINDLFAESQNIWNECVESNGNMLEMCERETGINVQNKVDEKSCVKY
jgi:DNA-binding response OmpR family regulator